MKTNDMGRLCTTIDVDFTDEFKQRLEDLKVLVERAEAVADLLERQQDARRKDIYTADLDCLNSDYIPDSEDE